MIYLWRKPGIYWRHSTNMFGELTYKLNRAERALTDANPDSGTHGDQQMIAQWRTDMDAAHEVIAQLHRRYPDTCAPF